MEQSLLEPQKAIDDLELVLRTSVFRTAQAC